jgi:hypothetical protein
LGNEQSGAKRPRNNKVCSRFKECIVSILIHPTDGDDRYGRLGPDATDVGQNIVTFRGEKDQIGRSFGPGAQGVLQITGGGHGQAGSLQHER